MILSEVDREKKAFEASIILDKMFTSVISVLKPNYQDMKFSNTGIQTQNARYSQYILRSVSERVACVKALPSFIPPSFAAQITEDAAVKMMLKMKRISLSVEGIGEIETAYVGPETALQGVPSLILLHAFDSSCLEFRRVYDLLAQFANVYAVDLIGWGFTDSSSYLQDKNRPLGPPDKRQHLLAFINTVVGTKQPITLLGTSLGGAVAMDFCLAYGSFISNLVLVDAQGFIDGLGPLSSMPQFVSLLGVRFLQTVGLRSFANGMAYYDKERCATDDAMLVGRLHTHLPGWVEANVAFIRSGGYALSTHIKDIRQPTVVVWGKQDGVLSPNNADKFKETLPEAQLKWINNCGHFPALEQPDILAEIVKEFIL